MEANDATNRSPIEGTAPQIAALQQAAALKQGGSPEALMGTMMAMLRARDGDIDQNEADQFIPLIQHMAERAELLVRRHLAEQVADLPTAPRGLLEFLAHDEIEVAQPLLETSIAFGDDLLIEVIEDKGEDHASAIAGRPQVSKTVSGAIIDTGAEQAIVILLRNAGAEIEKSSFDRLKEVAKDNGFIQQAMIDRTDLPNVIAQQIFWSARGALRQQILERFSIRPGQLDILLEEAVDDGLLNPEIIGLREEIETAISPTAISTRMPVSKIIEHIKAGRVSDFAKGVSSYLSIGKHSVKRILEDEGGEALAVLCRALDADRMQFTSVLLKNDYRRFGMPRPPGQIEQVSRIYDCISPGDALATVQMWDVLDAQMAA